MGSPFKTLQDMRNTRPTKPRATARSQTFVRPSRTTIFENAVDAASFYKLKTVETGESRPFPDRVQFTNPLDEFSSCLGIIFAASNFNFYRVMFQKDPVFEREHKIDISQVLSCMKMMSPVMDEDGEGPIDRVCNFVAFCKFVGFSIQGAHEMSDYDTAKSLIQSAFDSEKTEDLVFDVKTKLVPPDLIEVKSSSVEKATLNEATLSIPYRPIWAIAKQNERFIPLIVRETGEIDAFYACRDHHRFGSLRALVYSGLSVSFICYSLRHCEFPMV